MFNKLIKKASKFFAVLITVTLTFTSLSYAEPVSNFEQFRSAVTSATTSSIEITTDITATDSGALGTQASNDLTIQGQGNTVDANNNGGMVVVNNVFVSDIKMSTFSSIAGGGVIFVSKDNGNLTVQDSIFTHNTSAQHGGTINISGEADIKNSEFSENKAKWGGAIYNEGNLNIEDGVQFISNYAKNEGGAIYNAANSTVTFNGSAIFANNMIVGALNDVYSDGTLFFSSGTTTMQGGIVGVGTTTINGAKVNLENNATLEQYNLNILENSELSVNSEKLVIGNTELLNNGLLTFFAGTKILSNNIVGVGTTTLSNTNVTVDTTTITQYGLNMSSVSKLTSNADSLIISSEIVNDGMLKFTGGDNDNIIRGDGTLEIAGVVVNNADKKISQKKIEITEGHSFETNASDITTTDGILNNGQLTFTGGVNTSTITALYNKGELFVDGGYVGNTALITQNNITIREASILSSDINNIRAMEQILNDGTLVLTGTGINNNTIGHSGENLGNLLIGGSITNALGTKIDQNSIEVKTNSSFKTNADDITTMAGIINDGDLIFTGGTNINAINKGNSEYGKVFVTGDLINEARIEQYKIDISADTKLTSDADNLAISSEIVNFGKLKLTDGTNNNIIRGYGTLEISGDVINVHDKTIEQDKIEILENTSVFTAKASNLTAANGILNNGRLIFNSGGVSYDDNNNDINGVGELIIKDNGSGDYTGIRNLGNIKQSTITIELGSALQSDIDKIRATEQIINDGGLILTGTGKNNNIISRSSGERGELIISGEIINALGTKIEQNSIEITSISRFEANASDIVVDYRITNNGDLIFTGGENTSTVAGFGKLFVTGDLINNAAIEQTTIDVESNIFENVRGSLITAQTLTANTTFKTDANDLRIDNIILSSGSAKLLLLDEAVNAVLGANISGAGSLIKEGIGIVTLTGDNQYAGTTTISNGALRISSATNISDGEGKIIYMNGGTLMVAEDLALDSKIVGTFVEGVSANDVNILVESEKTATLTTKSKIHGEGDLVKIGEGTLDLQMESNNYLGNTIVYEGTLRGTTKNINGLLIGTGATNNSDTFEFYDAGTDVMLNEVDAINYIGTFNKTGSSTMTVINNFQAVSANISSGTFVINNDYIMGGSGKNFTVDREMIVNNALLKGYGDITVGKLIIGNGATFAPGNSTTTFKVTGDLEFQAGSTYDVEFSQLDMDKANEEQTNDKIIAGNTIIDPDSNIILNNTLGKYYVHETMTLIEAESMNDFVYNQEGEEVVTDKGDYKEIILGNVTLKDYDARALRAGYSTRISTNVYVENGNLMFKLERKASEYGTTEEFARSHNEQEAATAIDNISTGNGGDITLPLDVMEHFFYYKDPITGEANIPALKGALNDVAGVIHANSTMLTFTNAKIEHVYDKIQKRSMDLLPCTKFHDKIWGQYYYNTYNVKENENSPKFDTGVNGFLVGFDMISAKNWTVGVTAGYGISELKQLNDKTVMKDINLGFYGGYETDSWLFKGMLLGGYEQYNTDRNIRFMNRIASSEYNGFSTTLDLEAGYKIALNSSTSTHKLTLKPFIGITGSYISQEGFEEKGAESLNLKVEGYDNIVAQARAGVGINGKIKKFGWYANAGVRQFLTEDYNEIESSLLDYQAQTKMKIRSAELDKFSYGAGLGADYTLSDDWTIFANGLASFADKSNNYYGNIGLTYKFGCVNNQAKGEDAERMSTMLNEKIKEEENLKRELQSKEKELEEARAREKELQNRIQKYEANIVSEERAQQMREKTFKTMRLGERPTFKFGSDELTGNGRESIRQLARELQNYPDAKILIEGYTDIMGSDEINQKISENRASKVATTLKKEFNVQNDISVIGKGKANPIASNDTPEGRAKNRRVELIITTEK